MVGQLTQRYLLKYGWSIGQIVALGCFISSFLQEIISEIFELVQYVLFILGYFAYGGGHWFVVMLKLGHSIQRPIDKSR